MSAASLGVVMNGVTGRMGYRQHLLRSVLAIREQGGVELSDGTLVQLEPLLVGRDLGGRGPGGRLRQVRPSDEVTTLPLVDGGEGTLKVLSDAVPGAAWQSVPAVRGPDSRPVATAWLLLPDGTAAVELAQSSGLGLMAVLDPGGATTYGLGEVIAAAVRHSGTRRLLVALGGSATTDGGTGALCALGARFLDSEGQEVPLGGDGLRVLTSVHLGGLVAAPPEGVRCLVDVAAPLLGPVRRSTPVQPAERRRVA